MTSACRAQGSSGAPNNARHREENKTDSNWTWVGSGYDAVVTHAYAAQCGVEGKPLKFTACGRIMKIGQEFPRIEEGRYAHKITRCKACVKAIKAGVTPLTSRPCGARPSADLRAVLLADSVDYIRSPKPTHCGRVLVARVSPRPFDCLALALGGFEAAKDTLRRRRDFCHACFREPPSTPGRDLLVA